MTLCFLLPCLQFSFYGCFPKLGRAPSFSALSLSVITSTVIVSFFRSQRIIRMREIFVSLRLIKTLKCLRVCCTLFVVTMVNTDNDNDDGPVLSFNTTFRHWNWFQMSVETVGEKKKFTNNIGETVINVEMPINEHSNSSNDSDSEPARHLR